MEKNEIKGLTKKEVEEKIKLGNVNTTSKNNLKSNWQIVFDNVFTLFNLYNFIIAIALLAVKAYTNTFFFLIIVINVLIGIIQEIHAKNMIKKLEILAASKTTVIRDGKEEKIEVEKVVVDDIILLSPGDQIPSDSYIIDGEVEVNESLLTGESNLILKNREDKLLSGSYVVSGKCYAKVEKVGDDNFANQIVNATKKHKENNSELINSMKKVTKFTSFVIIPVGVFLFMQAYFLKESNLSQAVIATSAGLLGMLPKGLVLLITIALESGVIKLAKKDVLVQDLYSMESLAHIDTICLDKTGTITQGKLTVVDGKFSKENFEILQSLESKSNHPIAKSICSNIKNSYEVKEFEEVPGMGIKGIISNTLYFAGNSKFVNSQKLDNQFKKQEEEYSKKGYSIVYLFTKENVIAIVGLSDNIKPNMKKIISELYDMKMKVVMLTGDNNETAKMIADELNIKEVISNVSPKEKLEKVKELNKNNTCLMIGDGINDSPALKAALVGVSVANGTDISADSANIVLLNENMETLCNLIKIGNKTVKIIKQNLFWALFYNICMIPLATGLLPIHLNPMIASLAMTLSSLTVVLNSLRLKK